MGASLRCVTRAASPVESLPASLDVGFGRRKPCKNGAELGPCLCWNVINCQRIHRAQPAGEHMTASISERQTPWGANVLVEFEDGIAWVSLNRPDKRNAM